VERIQSTHAAQITELRVHVDNLRADNEDLTAQHRELYATFMFTLLPMLSLLQFKYRY